MKKKDTAPKKLLIADDSVEITQRLIEQLNEIDGIKILGPARSGRVALELFEQHTPHYMVLDLQIPELTGLEVLAAVRECDQSCVVIIVTFHSSATFHDRCLEAGADYFFNKAETLDSVVEVVRKLVEHSNE
ncbi:response regulator [Hahella sp. CR1]|uniref:response regulator transcription factor n=1 Tax=Hahella sp. CR1 TaxID=2992807 RepID=UPI002442ED10|nr:response regulator [Hahella sp. CR1]MDG9670858.1 response regulator [Hahella sp. CR1]